MNFRLGPGIYDTLIGQILADLLSRYPELRMAMSLSQTFMVESSLFTRSHMETQLVHELLEEMLSADAVNLLVSFIKWSGLSLLMPGFEDLHDRKVPVRVITTSYMGALDAPAIEWLALHLPNVQIRVSYDTRRTRIHANAWYFCRESGLFTTYFGFWIL
jgi:HKD family nuclease